jgi:hypothetical protein
LLGRQRHKLRPETQAHLAIRDGVGEKVGEEEC